MNAWLHRNNGKAQTSIELTVALVMFALLFVAAVKTFAWLNLSLVKRQRAYDNTRISASNTPMNQSVGYIRNLDNVSNKNLSLGEVKWNEPFVEELNLTGAF